MLNICVKCFQIPYSRKIWWGIKFSGLAVYLCKCQIKMRQYFILAYIHVVIPYRTAKFKSANIFAIAIWGPTTKFNSCQYFRLYGIWANLYMCSIMQIYCQTECPYMVKPCNIYHMVKMCGCKIMVKFICKSIVKC